MISKVLSMCEKKLGGHVLRGKKKVIVDMIALIDQIRRDYWNSLHADTCQYSEKPNAFVQSLTKQTTETSEYLSIFYVA